LLRLAGWTAFAAILIVVFAFGPGVQQRTLEATVRMEQLVHKLKAVRAIPEDTKREITNLMQQPSYDCNQMTCGVELRLRNIAARDRLQAVLGAETSDEVTASMAREPRPTRAGD
jgi:hypothetical protein